MKSVFSNGRTISAGAALFLVLTAVLACGFGNTKPEMPGDSTVQSLVKDTMSDFADAVDKGDFKTFQGKTSKEFQTQFTEDQLTTTFQSFTDQKALIVPILHDAAKQTAQFSTAPAIGDENGNYVLNTEGTFPSKPQTVKFTNSYVYQDGNWKLLKVYVELL